MNSIVRELQREALSKDVSTTDLLRKALVIAKKLKINEFETWVLNELNGYKDYKKVPKYREIRGVVKYYNEYYGWYPLEFENATMEEIMSVRKNQSRISEIEDLLHNENKDSSFQMPIASKIKRQLNLGYDITVFISRTSLIKIIDSVKNIILDWTLKLEEEGILGENMSFNQSEKEKSSKITYNIYGNINSSQFQNETINSTQTINNNSFDLNKINEIILELEKNLKDLSLKNDEFEEITSDIETIKSQVKSPKPKKAMIKEGVSSIRNILEGISASLIASNILEKIKLLGI